MSHRILHVLSQRPSLTGSGVVIDAMVRCAAIANWRQNVVVGVPRDDPRPPVGDLSHDSVHPLIFGDGDLDLPLPGMSDVMPYPSSRFSALSPAQLDAYRAAWRRHLGRVIDRFRPDLIHGHHVWLLSALLKDVAPGVPVVTHCHATGLRQMSLCPHLADEVRAGCARNDRFTVIHAGHADALVERLGVDRDRVHVVGQGFREDIFHSRGRRPGVGPALAYAGKYAHAKGLPQLLDAVDRVAGRRPDLVLHIAGDGAGPEAEALRARMAAMAPRVVMHGQLDPHALADLLRASAVFILPSFYEGLPLVLVEAAACGCRLVCTDLPGVREVLADPLGPILDLVESPRLVGPDVPDPNDVAGLVDRLEQAIESALARTTASDETPAFAPDLDQFRWHAVFRRIEQVWNELIATASPGGDRGPR